MALRINTNVAALNAHKNMTSTDNKLSQSLERLSSGLRINKAADDASGMSIADSLKSQSLGLGQAIKNANDGINIVQTADKALEESINIVNTIKVKATQASQDGQTTESRTAIQSDINKLMEELDTIAKTTSFNGQKLLSGNFTGKAFQTGAYAGETTNVSINSSESNKIGHVASTILKLDNNQTGGKVDLSVYSTIQNETYNIEAVEVGFTNNRQQGLGAVADAINKRSDVLGVTAKANVSSQTKDSIKAGTVKDLEINGTVIGAGKGIEVTDGDSHNSLINAINAQTNNHGVLATKEGNGRLKLTSTDGRAIEIKMNDETSKVFADTDMQTFGEIVLTQKGQAELR